MKSCDHSIAVACVDPRCMPVAQALAQSLRLPLLECDIPGSGVALWLLLAENSGLSLAAGAGRRLRRLRVDFEDRALLRRALQPGAMRQDLARALGLQRKRALVVVDATAGWGGDAWLMAALGCRVTLIERNPVLQALLSDGLSRGSNSAVAAVREACARMEMVPGDAIGLLSDWSAPRPDLVYLDPMFPARGSTAASRGAMQALQALVGEDGDEQELLDAALRLAVHRVVVKRPRKAMPVAGRPPSHRIVGSSTRFDVYVLRGFAS